MTPKQIWAWVGALVGGGGVITLLLWGVPYYIDVRVDAKVKELVPELVSDPGESRAVVEVVTKVDNLEAGQVRIEGKVDAFSEEFLRYLERQSQ